MNNCEHLNTTLTFSPYFVQCDDCGKQWDEDEWTEYQENKDYYDEVLENQATDLRN